MSHSVLLLYPHQLYRDHAALQSASVVWLIEDPLFFSHYAFHSKKLILHRASMKNFAHDLVKKGKFVRYVDALKLTNSQQIAEILSSEGVDAAQAIEPNDAWLKSRVQHGCDKHGIRLNWVPDPAFLTSHEVQRNWLGDRQKFPFTDFYRQQRTRLGYLMEGKKPSGGKWTFDTENRKKLPKGIEIPEPWKPVEHSSVDEAKKYVRRAFPNALGDADGFAYPISHADAESWLEHFLKDRFASFGDYEDAIDREQTFLFHSVLTPMLNIGLLTPKQVVDGALAFVDTYPLNSVEGFIRQVIGWREFVRMIYLHVGRLQRTRNYWNFDKPMPAALYTGTTGIVPIDRVIDRVMKHAYCHHIERLMVLGNFFVLCEIDPDEVYRWFMELFIDAYDWVMVPNVYGMSQYADGGLMTTKPYISGSSYILKMSNFEKGPWCPIWDALYWRFIAMHRDFFKSNPRMSVMVSQLEKMGSKLSEHQRVANDFLNRLHGV